MKYGMSKMELYKSMHIGKIILFFAFVFFVLQMNLLSTVFAVANEPSLKDSICVRGDSNTKFYVYVRVTGDVDDVKFPTWTELNGQDDLLADWSTNALTSGEEGVWQIDGKLYNWRYLVDISQHNNEYGKYLISVYSIKDGNRKELGTACAYNFAQTYTQADARYFLKMSAPQLKDSIVTRTQDNSYFDVYANIEGAVQKVQFPTWTSANGQDDLGVWPDGVAGNYSVNGKSYNYKCRIKLSEHNNEYGAYIIHIYAKDIDGKSIYLGGKTINFQEYASQDSTVVKESGMKIARVLNVRGLNTKRFYVYCYVEGNVEKVQFPTWTELNGQDDLLTDWDLSMDVRGENGNWQIYNEGETLTYNYRFQVDIAQHNNEYGTYNVHIYAFDGQGTVTSLASKLNFLEDPNIDAAGILEETTAPKTIKSKVVREGDIITLYRRTTDLRGIDYVNGFLALANENGAQRESYSLKGKLEIGEYELDGEIYNSKYNFNISELHLKEEAIFQPSMRTYNIAGNDGIGGFESKFTEDYLGAYSEEKVVFDRALVIKENTNGYYIYINVNSTEGNIKNVMYPTWTAYAGKLASGGYDPQDDIDSTWSLQEGGNSYGEKGNWIINGNQYNNRFYVDRAIHNNEYGVYYTHIYVYDELLNSNKINIEVNFQSNSIQGEHTDVIDGVSQTYDILYAWPTCVLYENGKAIARESLSNAINKIPYGSQDKYEIIMEQDEELATTVVIPENKQVNLDLRGKTISLQHGGSSVLQVQGTLYLYDTVGNGKIEAVQPDDVAGIIYAIQNSGSLYIGNKDGVLTQGLTITATSNNAEACGIHASKGTVTLGVNDGEINTELKVIGKTYGYYAENLEPTLQFYDGTITGASGNSVVENGSTIYTPNTYSVIRTSNADTTETAILGFVNIALGDISFGKMLYDGTSKEPTPALIVNGIALVRGIDYTIQYENNIDSGIAKAIITGIGNYTGTIESEFLIYIDKTEVNVTGLTTQSSAGSHDCNNYAVDKYDETNHWKECSICSNEYAKAGRPMDVSSWTKSGYLELKTNSNGERILVVKGTFTNHSYENEYWTLGDSCSINNKLRHTCNCGYSYDTNNTRAHGNFIWGGNNAFHSYICVKCMEVKEGYTMDEPHKDANGNILDCNNVGTCVICGLDTGIHVNDVIIYAYEDGFIDNGCYMCHQKLVKGINKTLIQNGTQFTFEVEVEFNTSLENIYFDKLTKSYYGRIDIACEDAIISGNKVTLKGQGNFNDTVSEQVDRVNLPLEISQNGKTWRIYLILWMIKPDNVAPTFQIQQNEIQQVNNWSTGTQITINGTENYCKSVTIKMRDTTNQTIVYEGTANVTNQNYSYTFLPNIAAEATGKEYEIIVTDTLGNSSSQTITISKVDHIAPEIVKDTQLDTENVWSTTMEWSRLKDFKITATDEGSQVAKVKFQDVNNSVTNYHFTDDYGLTNRNTEVNPILNIREYQFTGDVNGYVTATVYFVDEAGNESTEYLRIYNLDNTAPKITIQNIAENNKIKDTEIQANLTDSASGIRYFAVTKAEDIDSDGNPIEPTTYGNVEGTTGETLNYWYPVANAAKDNPTETEARNVNISFTDLTNGEYYLWVQDLVGNISYEKVTIEVNAFITEWTIPVDADGVGLGTTILLPIPTASTNSYTVYWGDGTTDNFTTEAFPAHTYTNTIETAYEIKISGKVDRFGYNEYTSPTATNSYKNYYTFTQYLTGLKQWGEIEATQYGFSNCVNLIGIIPVPTEKSFENITTFIYTFYGCSGLTGAIPTDLFANAPNVTIFGDTFGDCSGLTGSIPENLFANTPNVTVFDHTFSACSGLTGSIPENLFANTPNVTNFDYTFSICSGLTGSIPENLFANTPNVTNFECTFLACSGLTGSIPENLFANTPNVTSFGYTFGECSGLTGSIPENLFANTPNVTSFEGTFLLCSGLTSSIPENLFANTPNVTSFDDTFSFCSGLTGSIPAELFANTPNVTTFSSTFSFCSGLTGSIPAELFVNTSNVTSFLNTFWNCSGITAGELQIDTTNVDMSYMFSGCTSLESLVLGKDFKNINGADMFETCSALRAIILLNDAKTTADVGEILDVTSLGLASGTIFYVPYKETESIYEQAWSNIPAERIEQVVKAVEPNPDYVGLNQEYIDPGYTVAGFTMDEAEKYTQYGFYVEAKGTPVDTSTTGSKWIEYVLKRK